MAKLLLGIDVGTYSSKGVVVDADGKVLARHVVPHSMDVPRPGWAEQDADAVWWSDVVSLCRKLLADERFDAGDVAGVGISAIGPCLLPLGADDRPLRKGILYGVDTRAGREITELEAQLGIDEVYRFSGMRFTSQAIGPKILWLQRHEPDVWRHTKRLTTASSYVVLRLTGEHVIDRHTAGHYMPLMDLASGAWSEKFADAVAPLDMLPRLGWSDERAGTVTAAAAAETGLKEGTPVAVGAVDALSEAISVGAVRAGDLMVMYGSTTFFVLVLPRPLPDPRTWTVPGAFRGQFNLAAGMATTGSVTRWLRDEFAAELDEADAYRVLFERAAEVPPGSDGVLMLPYFSGERTPINDPEARGVIAGLSLGHSRDHVFRAALEGVAFGIRHNLDTFREMGAPIERVLAVGGGAQGGTWLQIVSDVTGVDQVVANETIGAAYGDAFLAGRAAGILEPDAIDRWVTTSHVVRPRSEVAPVYDRMFDAYLELYRSSRDVVHVLSAMGRGMDRP